MDPPVLPRLLNALKFELSEENFDATIGLLADTPDATVCSSAHPPLASHCSRGRSTRARPCLIAEYQVVEVGAHNGVLAIHMSRLPHVKSILSFEPTPGRAEEIRKGFNTHLANAPDAIAKITVRGDAVSNYTGTARFFTSSQVDGAVNSLGQSRV
jgi:hypothetical protein